MTGKRNEIRFVPGKLSKLRKQYRMTRNLFAKQVGTTSYQIKLWELGEVVPGTKKLVVMCNRFDVDPNYFFNAGVCNEKKHQ